MPQLRETSKRECSECQSRTLKTELRQLNRGYEQVLEPYKCEDCGHEGVLVYRLVFYHEFTILPDSPIDKPNP